MSKELDQRLDDAWAARREGRLVDAYALAERAARISRSEKRRPQLVRALMILGQVERDRGRYDAAMPFYVEAVEQARMVDGSQLLAHALRHLGDLLVQLGRLQRAEYCFAESIKIYEQQQGTKDLDLANAIRPLALLMEQTSQPVQAATYWRAAMQLYEAAGIEAGVLECRQAIARCTGGSG